MSLQIAENRWVSGEIGREPPKTSETSRIRANSAENATSVYVVTCCHGEEGCLVSQSRDKNHVVPFDAVCTRVTSVQDTILYPRR